MAIIAPERVPEESSAKFTCSFKDRANGNAVTPATITWSLFDVDGNVINSRSAVSVSPASTVEIWLNGDDLVINDQMADHERRKLLIESTYNNGSAVVNLKEEVYFAVYNLTGVS